MMRVENKQTFVRAQWEWSSHFRWPCLGAALATTGLFSQQDLSWQPTLCVQIILGILVGASYFEHADCWLLILWAGMLNFADCWLSGRVVRRRLLRDVAAALTALSSSVLIFYLLSFLLLSTVLLSFIYLKCHSMSFIHLNPKTFGHTSS